MRYRKLRIAWSVACGLLAVLLIALWVRSCWWFDGINMRPWPGRVAQVGQKFGCVRILAYPDEREIPDRGYFNRRLKWEGQISSQDVLWFGTETMDFGGSNGMSYYFRHWFLVSVVASLTVVPWFPWPKRYSLRALLIATTLIAVVLGLVVYAARK